MKRARCVALAAAVLLAGALAGGCSWMPGRAQEPGYHEQVPGFVALSDATAVRAALLDQYRAWQGVPHRSGGSDRRGLDCSAFAQLTFRQRFGIELPRATDAQRSAGRTVEARRITPGDLLFFDTGVFARHVGIYVGGRTFLHVSTRAGVMLSGLDDAYWAPRFTAAVRVR